MTKVHLISERVAPDARDQSRRLNSRLSARVDAGVEAATTALEEWEAEGGASAAVPQAREHAVPRPSPPIERVLLERLGAALVGEWNHLPARLQRAVYERAAAGGSSSTRVTRRREMARFLHDHKRPGRV